MESWTIDSTPVASTTMLNPNGCSPLVYPTEIYVRSFEVLDDIHLDTFVGGDDHLARAVTVSGS